ncbi:hypothetical protein ColTof3_12559 [Colletotrichum tofieldiae]|nr:hypothetical protein ColTof3_12559 [Colletotrichum tofieldiae]
MGNAGLKFWKNRSCSWAKSSAGRPSAEDTRPEGAAVSSSGLGGSSVGSGRAKGSGMSRSRFISKPEKSGTPQSIDDRKPCLGDINMPSAEAKRSRTLAWIVGVGEGRLGVLVGA